MRSFNKVFGIGLSRTGTKSLTAALEALGIPCQHFPSIEANIRSGDYRLPQLETYRALTDTPIVRIYKELDRAYPGSLFILTTRSVESWLQSCEGYFRAKDAAERGTPLDHLNRFHRLYTYGCEGYVEERFRQVFTDHEADVLRYFSGRESDLLVLDLEAGDGWRELCGFLSLPMPEVPFPRLNTFKELGESRYCASSTVVTITDTAFLPATELMLHSFLEQNAWFHGKLVVLVDNTRNPVYQRLKRFPSLELQVPSRRLRRRIQRLKRTLPSLDDIAARFLTLEAFRFSESGRVLFLDSDILVRGNLYPLFQLPGGFYAAPDSCHYRETLRDQFTYRQVERAHLKAYGTMLTGTFNSGVMLIRPNRLSIDVYDRLLRRLEPNTWAGIEVPKLADQIVLNRELREANGWLSSRYNFVIFLEQLIKAKEGLNWWEADVVHFAGPIKPWLPLNVSRVDQRILKFVDLWTSAFTEYIERLPSADRAQLNSYLGGGLSQLTGMQLTVSSAHRPQRRASFAPAGNGCSVLVIRRSWGMEGMGATGSLRRR